MKQTKRLIDPRRLKTGRGCAYPKALRLKIKRARLSGKSLAEVSAKYRVSKQTVLLMARDA
jgi:hypothetical protein